MKEHLPSRWEGLNMNTNSGFIQSICMQGGVRGHGRALLFALVCFSLSLSLFFRVWHTTQIHTLSVKAAHANVSVHCVLVPQPSPLHPFNIHNGAFREYKSCYRKPPKREWKGCPTQALMITGSLMNTYYFNSIQYLYFKAAIPCSLLYFSFLEKSPLVVKVSCSKKQLFAIECNSPVLEVKRQLFSP